MVKKFFLKYIIHNYSYYTSRICQEIFKVTSVNFDTANSMLFLTSVDNTTETIMKNVKLIKLQNPKRVYFDIDSAVLTAAPQDWYLNSGGIKRIKISQFSHLQAKFV